MVFAVARKSLAYSRRHRSKARVSPENRPWRVLAARMRRMPYGPHLSLRFGARVIEQAMVTSPADRKKTRIAPFGPINEPRVATETTATSRPTATQRQLHRTLSVDRGRPWLPNPVNNPLVL
jgi:hypothetical protein